MAITMPLVLPSAFKGVPGSRGSAYITCTAFAAELKKAKMVTKAMANFEVMMGSLKIISLIIRQCVTKKIVKVDEIAGVMSNKPLQRKVLVPGAFL
jgi:hypothetical protein